MHALFQKFETRILLLLFHLEPSVVGERRPLGSRVESIDHSLDQRDKPDVSGKADFAFGGFLAYLFEFFFLV